MAREFAQVRLAMWSDDDVRALSPAAQHLYFVLLTAPSLSHCGVADWRPNRIAALAAGWTVEAVRRAAAELIEKFFIVVDEATEEVLVRSFVRHDGLMKQPRMATAMSTAHAAVASSTLRGVIVHELIRLRREQPDLNGWGGTGVADLLGKGSVDPSTYPLGNGSGEGSRKGSEKGSVKGSGNPKPTPSGKGSGEGCPTPAPTPAPATSTERTALRAASDEPEPNAGTITAAWVDAITETGTRPTGGMRGQVGRTVKELLTAGNDPQRVLDAARVAGTKGFATVDRELAALAGRRPTVPAEARRDPHTGRAVDWA